MSYFDDYTDSFAELIERELAGTLSQELCTDFSRTSAEEIVRTIEDEHEERFLLIDKETGQMESRRLFESLDEVEKAIKELPQFKNCDVGVFLLSVR